MINKSTTLSLLACIMLSIPMLGGSAIMNPVQAYDGCATCDRLWYLRNAIYARNGYCFKTKRARAVFRRRCYPPYGKLSTWEQQRVSQIRRRERNLACKSRCW